MSSPPSNPPRLHHGPAANQQQQHLDYTQSQKELHVKRYKGEDNDDDGDADDDDVDDVFEDEGFDKYLSFPHQEEQSQGETFESFSSFLPSSSAEDEIVDGEYQGASGGQRR